MLQAQNRLSESVGVVSIHVQSGQEVRNNQPQGTLLTLHTAPDDDGFEVPFALRTNELPPTLSKI